MTSLTMLVGDLVIHDPQIYDHDWAGYPVDVVESAIKRSQKFDFGIIIGFNLKSLMGMKGFEVAVLRSDGRIVSYPSSEIRVVSDAGSDFGA